MVEELLIGLIEVIVPMTAGVLWLTNRISSLGGRIDAQQAVNSNQFQNLDREIVTLRGDIKGNHEQRRQDSKQLWEGVTNLKERVTSVESRIERSRD